MNSRISIGVLSALAAVLVGIPFEAGAQQHGNSLPAASLPTACVPAGGCIPTISTKNLGSMGDFYVGGEWAGKPGSQVMSGAIFVEAWVPKKVQHPYPIVFVQGGGGQTLLASVQTPDGRPGWAYDFLNAGYTVYMVDAPGTGRSAYFPGLYPPLTPPRPATQLEEEWTGGLPPAPQTEKAWPQWKKHTEWPGTSPHKGKIGDPIFDYYAKTEVQYVAGYQEKLFSDALIQLLDLIGKPVIMLVNSGYAPSGWVAADARPNLIKGVIAVEPWAPPIENAELVQTGPGRLWGLSNLPLHYDPPITSPAQLHPVRQKNAPKPGLVPCWLQQEPAHKLKNMEAFPVLDVSGEASYHRPYARCVAEWLNQAGVKTTYVNLEDVGLRGNGHQMMSEKNSAGIAKFFMQWLDKNVH
ncbi:MAG: alpha/beta hydrolase family protein [Acidobacteriaceae bacterium]